MLPISKQDHYSPKITIENLQRAEMIMNKRISKNFNAVFSEMLDKLEKQKEHVK